MIVDTSMTRETYWLFFLIEGLDVFLEDRERTKGLFLGNRRARVASTLV